MTGTPQAESTAQSTPAIQPSPSALRARRSPRLVAAGVLLACLGGLGAGAAWSQASDANQVVVIVRAVDRGEVVEAGDLASTTIGSAPGVQTIPASEISSLVGKRALTDLPAGSLVGRSSVGDPPPSEGATLGLRLAAGRLPLQPLPAGTNVQLVPVASSKAGTEATGDLTPIDATIVTAPQPMQDGANWLVDVQVSPGTATRVAQLAAGEQLVLVKKAGA